MPSPQYILHNYVVDSLEIWLARVSGYVTMAPDTPTCLRSIIDLPADLCMISEGWGPS